MPKSDRDPQPNVFGYEGYFPFPLAFWGWVILTGVATGLTGGALMMLLRAAQHTAWLYKTGDFLTAVSHCAPQRRVTVLLIAGVMVGVARILLRRLTGGHGGEVAESIWFRSARVPFFRTISSGVISMLAVALGAAVGREAAPKQAGAALGSLFAEWGKLSSSQRRLLVGCGAGAGLAAVYNVPLGGALFALEVLLGTLSLSLVLPALATSLIAVAVSWLFLPNEATYFFPSYPFSPIALAGSALLGALAGFISVLYVKGIAWADTRKPKGPWVVLAPILVLTALGTASIYYPELLGNGKNVVQLAFNNQLSLGLLVILFFCRPIATVGCLGSGTPGGLFTPTLTAGALLGGLFGWLWNRCLPGEATAAYAIFGAAALLAASTKGPLSTLVLVFELTNHDLTLAVPLILAITVATLVARRFELRSIYSARIHEGKAAATKINNDQVISSAAHYEEVLNRLLPLARQDQPLYVVDKEGSLIGKITVAQVSKAKIDSLPLETTSADDLAVPLQPGDAPASLSKLRF